MELTQERLQEILNYDPETGIWTWRIRVANCVQIGDIAGRTDTHGYRQITINGVAYLASRLAFLWMIGRWPAVHVDHEDTNTSNDRWSNLREATRSQNFANQHAYANNKLGVKGVHRRKNGRYMASIQIEGHKIMLGEHDTIAEAAACYATAAEALFGEFARVA